MRHGRFEQVFTCNTCTLLFTSIFYPFASLPVASAQDNPEPLTPSTRSSVTMPPTTHTISLLQPPTTFSTNPSYPGQPLLETPVVSFNAAEQPRNGTTTKNRVINYYFLVLALLTGILAAALWWLHRQRAREREQLRLRGHSALARDVERWTIFRRSRPHSVEGRNEAGEAPPPYQPKGDTILAHELVTNDPDSTADVTIPPRAILRDDTDSEQPPKYVEEVLVNHGTVTRSNT